MAANGDRLVFGHMHEDHAAELRIARQIAPARALVIASGGDLPFALAATGMSITAVDSNPAQIRLVEFKRKVALQSPAAEAAAAMIGTPSLRIQNMSGEFGFTNGGIRRGLCFSGKVDGLLRLVGPFIAWLHDWPRLRSGVLRAALIHVLSGFLPFAVRLTHGPAAGASLNAAAIRLMRQRLNAAMRQSDASQNPLLHSTFGRDFGPVPPAVWSECGIAAWAGRSQSMILRAQTVQEALSGAEPGSFDLVSLSNLPDVLSEDEWFTLEQAVARALAVGGYLVVRSMLQSALRPAPGFAPVEWEEAARIADTSPLCKVVRVAVRSN